MTDTLSNLDLPKYLDEWMECWHDEKDRQLIEHYNKNASKA